MDRGEGHLTQQNSTTNPTVIEANPTTVGETSTSDEVAVTSKVPVEVSTHIDPVQLALRVEAVLVSTDRPLSTAKLSQLLEDVGAKAINAAVKDLNRFYEETERSFRVENLAGGWQILTLPRFAAVIRALNKSRESMKLGPAALETLAVIAYKQPVLRADVEAIRGVACGEVIRTLMERRLVKIVGRAQELGRPMLYGTTHSFLKVFGLSNLKDLPKTEDFGLKAL